VSLAAAIDDFESALAAAKSVPFTDQVRIDFKRLYDLLDQTREALLDDFGSALAIHESAPSLLVLIDDLNSVVHDAPAIPLTDYVRLRREDVAPILQEMRAAMP
jgi:hypothetical protein